MLPSLLVAGALALPASAFLISAPAFRQVNGEARQLDDTNVNKLELNAKCFQCPFAEITNEPSPRWEDLYDVVLNLNFTTDGTVLSMNDKQIYPILNLPSDLEAVLYRQSDHKTSSPLPVGYVFERLVRSPVADNSGAEFLVFNFMVIDVAGYPVHVDTVNLRVVQLPNGDLFMVGADIEQTSPKMMSWRECRGSPSCLKSLIMTRIRSILASAKTRAMAAARKIKGCGGRKPYHGGFVAPAGPYRGKPHHGPHHGPHRHRSSFAKAFARTIHAIMVPAILGLSAGILACAVGVVGVLIGQGIAALWLRHRRSSNTRGRTDNEHGDDVEKEPLYVPEGEALPPQYEEEDYGTIVLPIEKE
ncbi:hypothetical protein FQN55_007836 [Onygenales sp. PD_40]|nr:hypothetical protein FQN55_007836 [Onygenales sp. PD_40]KAK2772347.1 hypothetical protein FQN52_004915 [Onygenales sp. PD_12]